jgi:hypothetical membrane protein
MQIALRKVFLAFGVLAPILFLGTDALAGVSYPGYSFTSQAISELFAIGAPTSRLVVPLFTLADVLLLAFAWGVWMSAGQKKILRVTALMLVGNAVNGLFLWNIFPMHLRGGEQTLTDTMHVGLSGLGVFFVLLAVASGAVALGKRFRLYSAMTMAMLVVPSMVVFFLYVPQIAANLPTPWTGLAERISTYGYEPWQAALAIILLRTKRPAVV